MHEFYEWNNGNLVNGPHRIDNGSVPNGHYGNMDIRYLASGTPRFEMWRGGLLRGTVPDDGWRDWSLFGATFEVFSESWDIGDQLGGTSTDKEVMDNSGWILDFGIGVQSLTMGACYVTPDTHGGDYDCTSFTGTSYLDSVRTWTNAR